MKSIKTLQWLNAAGFVFMIVMNTLANALPLFGRNTGEISALFPNLFVPSGFTFSIWGLIYLLLLIFTVAQMKGALGGKSAPPAYVAAIGPWFFLSSMANGLWILAWHALQPLLSLAVMLLLLWSLIRIYQALNSGSDSQGKYAARLPFSVYLGWISVATIANATAVLVHYDWSGFGIGPAVWTVAMIAVAVLAGVVFLWKKSDAPYALVILWALYGILARTDAVQFPTIYYALLGGMILLGIGSVLRVPRWVKQ